MLLHNDKQANQSPEPPSRDGWLADCTAGAPSAVAARQNRSNSLQRQQQQREPHAQDSSSGNSSRSCSGTAGRRRLTCFDLASERQHSVSVLQPLRHDKAAAHPQRLDNTGDASTIQAKRVDVDSCRAAAAAAACLAAAAAGPEACCGGACCCCCCGPPAAARPWGGSGSRENGFFRRDGQHGRTDGFGNG